MKKYSIFLVLPLLALLMGCQGGASAEEEKTALEAKVLHIHDEEAMPRMGEIYKLRRSLRQVRDTLAAQQADSASLQALQQEISGLDRADEAMMQWMRQYSAPDTLQHEQAMQYLQEELSKIERVQVIMDSAIEAARKTATKYEQH